MSDSIAPSCRRRRFTRFMSSSARAWRPSPATTCRSSIASGILAEHLHTRAAAGLFDVSHMGQAVARGAGSRDDRARARGAVPRRHSRSRARPPALHQFLNAEGGIVDDLMVDAAAGRRRPARAGRQRGAQGDRFRAAARDKLPAAVKLTPRETRRSSPCRARRRPPSSRGSRPAAAWRRWRS